jgi:hypothetical protein
MAATLTEQEWHIRLAIYRFFVAHERPPSATEIASKLELEPAVAQRAYRRLHDAHELLLEPGTDTIRMAIPLSAVETCYRVRSGGSSYYANCAFDSLGVPAMLAADAEITASNSAEPIQFTVVDGRPQADNNLVIHFSVPYRDWKIDHIHT